MSLSSSLQFAALIFMALFLTKTWHEIKIVIRVSLAISDVCLILTILANSFSVDEVRSVAVSEGK